MKKIILLVGAVLLMSIVYVGFLRGDNKDVGAVNNYVGYSVDECSRVQVSCVPGFKRFDDESGCGCEPVEGAVSGEYEINLRNQGLSKIPEYVFSKTNTERLNVSNNMISGSIQSQIGQLQNLKVLDASNNQMTGVPAEIGQLQKLEVLDLSNNKLTGLPNELGNLKNLKVLSLAGNQYSKQDLEVIREGLPRDVNIITD